MGDGVAVGGRVAVGVGVRVGVSVEVGVAVGGTVGVQAAAVAVTATEVRVACTDCVGTCGWAGVGPQAVRRSRPSKAKEYGARCAFMRQILRPADFGMYRYLFR